MKILRLTLKKKYFDMILSGDKKEEYREIKPYWISRLCIKHPKSVIAGGDLRHNHSVQMLSVKEFDFIEFKNGYGENVPKMIVRFEGLEINEPQPQWSDSWTGNVFVIKLGEITDYKNLKN